MMDKLQSAFLGNGVNRIFVEIYNSFLSTFFLLLFLPQHMHPCTQSLSLPCLPYYFEASTFFIIGKADGKSQETMGVETLLFAILRGMFHHLYFTGIFSFFHQLLDSSKLNIR